MRQNKINPQITQDLLESAPNALQKGQAQYFTPKDTARILRKPLPHERDLMCDFSCGDGALLDTDSGYAWAEDLLGADIDDCRERRRHVDFIHIDCTLLYPLMRQIDWRCPLFLLNPPWGLHWKRERLDGLKDSSLPAVQAAYAGKDPQCGQGTIDSTIASLLMALDRCDERGEGVMLLNADTLDRLILNDGAPHRAVRQHLWLISELDHNPMTPSGKGRVAAVWFAASHVQGPKRVPWGRISHSSCRIHHQGLTRQAHHSAGSGCVEKWTALKEEAKRRRQARRTPYNLWLNEKGFVRINLNAFDEQLMPDRQDEIRELRQLDGLRPVQIVMQRKARQLISDHTNQHSRWKVQPGLHEKIEQAVGEYNTQRAPLYPLPDIQRMGYLDEEDTLVCTRDLGPFRDGKRYNIDTYTVPVERRVERPNLQGEMEELLLSGKELVAEVHHRADKWLFCSLSALNDSDQVRRMMEEGAEARGLDVLAGHFAIPDVPDVSVNQPEAYQRNLSRLNQLEADCTTLSR